MKRAWKISITRALMAVAGISGFFCALPAVANDQADKCADETSRRFSGNISWYGVPFHGKKTASGRIYDMNKLTCAHRTLPFGTRILIENPRNGKSVVVEVIDRGPYANGRIIDVSREAARELGTLVGGIAYVNCLVIYMPGDPVGPEQVP